MRSDEVITLDIADIKSTHSDFNADAVIVLQADKELPSQINDLDRDGSGDKLVFLTDMKPGEHQSVVVRYNPEGKKQRSYTKS